MGRVGGGVDDFETGVRRGDGTRLTETSPELLADLSSKRTRDVVTPLTTKLVEIAVGGIGLRVGLGRLLSESGRGDICGTDRVAEGIWGEFMSVRDRAEPLRWP